MTSFVIKQTGVSKERNASQGGDPCNEETPCEGRFASDVCDHEWRHEEGGNLDGSRQKRVPEDVATEWTRVEREAVIHEVVRDPETNENNNIQWKRFPVTCGTRDNQGM